VTTSRPARGGFPRPGQWVRLALAGAAAVALVVLAASGWLIAAAVVGVGSWHAIGAWQQRNAGGVSDLDRIDALASWIENLRDVLIAGDQPVGAINATVNTCPAAIKPQVRRLAAGLGRQDPAIVFRRFADDVDDPLGDLVAAGLLIAVQRGARTAAVLGSLAEQARRQADRRRLVEAERAPIQREVTLLTVIMGTLVVGLLVFGRAEYLEPYDSAGGQLFLGPRPRDLRHAAPPGAAPRPLPATEPIPHRRVARHTSGSAAAEQRTAAATTPAGSIG
jgi:tight adherence protein B